MTRFSTTAAALLAATFLTLAQTPASAAFITTGFAGGNGIGDPGAGVFFDIDVGPNALTILGLTTNTGATSGTTPGFDIWTRPGTAQGAESSSTGWTLATSGSITPQGEGNESPVVLDAPISLDADTLYGFALVYPTGAEYTNGDGCTDGAYSLTGNCFVSNADLTLLMGSSKASPFTSGAGSVFSPRNFNGTIEYEVADAPLPGTLALLGLGLAGVRLARRRR